jgi:LDH2 family malate/lactate/ureidoglycolate dehydrogenase
LPGEIDFNCRVERERDGIPLDDTTWQQIREVAEGLGISADPQSTW